MPKLSTTRFTETALAELRRAAGKTERVHFDAATDNLGVRFRRGRATLFFWYRAPGLPVKKVWLGAWPKPLSLDDARAAVGAMVAKVARGDDPFEERRRAREAARAARRRAEDAKAGTIKRRFKLFLRSKKAEGLRTAGEYESVFNRHIAPAWGTRSAHELSRRDVAQLLDKIANKHGVKLADRVLAYVRPFLTWHAAKYDHPAPVFAKLRRLKPDAMRRERSLDDDEIRLMWATALEFKPDAAGALMRLLLATGMRRTEVAGMRHDEIGADGLWVIPAKRFKGKREHAVPLSKTAREIIAGVPKLTDEFVLSTGHSHVRGFAKFKRDFDAKMIERAKKEAEEAGGDPDKVELKPWRLHDLRRTARSLLSRAGVRADWAEIYIGHTLPGLRKTYDRYGYMKEKRFAADALAHMIDRVLKREAGDGDVLEFKAAR
jgi:integrase